MEDATSVELIIERLKLGLNAKSDTALGRKLGVGQQSVSNARITNKIPDSWIRKAAEGFTLSADWLLFGQGHMHRGEIIKNDVAPNSIDRSALLNVVEVLEEFLNRAKKNLPPTKKAEAIYQLYQMIIEEEADAKTQPLRVIKLIQNALSEDE